MHKCFFGFAFFFFISCSAQHLNQDKFVALGTYLEVVSSDERAAEIVYREVRRLEAIFNQYDSGSEVYKINSNPGTKVVVSEELIELIVKAKKYYQLTEGAFDISRGKLYNFWKNRISQGNIFFSDSKKIDDLRQSGGINKIKIDPDGNTVKIKEGVQLDLAGAAKGYIVDKAVKKLKESGILSALVNAGGDVYCLGENRNRPWQVGVKNPLGGATKSLALSDQAVATSGNYQQFLKKKGRIYSHLIDPRTGYPVVRQFLGLTVVAKECWEADILATAFFINGWKFTRDFLKENPEIKAYLVFEDRVVGFLDLPWDSKADLR